MIQDESKNENGDENGDETMSESATIKRLNGLLRLYEQGFQSAFVDRAVGEMIAAEAENTESELRRLRQKLEHYEQRYHMISADFYSRFRTGELGADIDVVEWSVFYDLYQGVQGRLQELHRLL